MRQFEQFLQENSDRSIYLSEACAAIGVTERTLRLHCDDSLGMGPHKYLWLRRINLARRSLALADPKATNVTAIALDYGFAELGRFAVAYRKLFGESPSATLRSASGAVARKEKLPSIRPLGCALAVNKRRTF
jgi:AraC-like DNA-binding protein